nr:hypothetical protein KPHV_84310 [Kitasatospora purpeofusca]
MHTPTTRPALARTNLLASDLDHTHRAPRKTDTPRPPPQHAKHPDRGRHRADPTCQAGERAGEPDEPDERAGRAGRATGGDVRSQPHTDNPDRIRGGR